MPELHALKSENWKGFNSLFGIKDKSRDILGKLTLLNQGLVKGKSSESGIQDISRVGHTRASYSWILVSLLSI